MAVSLSCVVSKLFILKLCVSTLYFSKINLWCYKLEGLKTENKQASNSNNPILGIE